MPYIDDFEDGDLVTKSDVWDGWNGATASASTSNSNNCQSDTGSPEVLIPVSSGDISGLDTVYTGSQTNDPASLSWYVYKGQMERHQYIADGDQQGNIKVYFFSNGQIDIYDGDNRVNIGTWSAGTPYKVKLDFDWGNNQFDITITNASDGSTVASRSNNNPTNTPYSEIEEFHITSYDSDLYFDDLKTAQPPTAASSLSVDAARDSELDLSWTDGDYEDGYYIYRAQSSGSSTSDYTQVATVGAGTTSYTDSGLLNGEQYYYRVQAYNSTGTSSLSNEASGTTTLPAPSGVSATFQSDDQIDVSWTDNADNTANFYVQISRDGASYVNPSGGPTQPSSTSASYGPNSDSSYDSQVGIDSSFQFRVRAETAHTESAWSSASPTVYTTPLQPHNPSMNRPDSNTVEFNYETKSDIGQYTVIQIRRDDGSGYGSWTNWDQGPASPGSSHTYTVSVGDSVQYGDPLQEDERYQFRMDMRRQTPNDSGYSRSSQRVYLDYGNNGNVYFEDDFESNDLSAWDSTSLGDSDSGVISGEEPGGDSGISGADQGSYYLHLESGDYITANLGDLSGESDVIVKAAMAAGSMDSSGEHVDIEWYDGSAWNDLRQRYWEYNKQGWTEISALVPSSWLSTDNRIRLRGYGGSGDYGEWDRVVVSDVLHEYTKPSDLSGLSADSSIEDEITTTWTDNATFASGFDTEYKRSSDTSWTDDGNNSTTTTRTYTGLLDGEQYDFRARTFRYQYRRGAFQGSFLADTWVSASDTTVLPAPTSLSVSNVTADTADFSWTNNHDYGTVTLQYKQSDAGSWTEEASGLDRSVESYQLQGLLDGEQYDFRVVAVTEHTGTVDQ